MQAAHRLEPGAGMTAIQHLHTHPDVLPSPFMLPTTCALQGMSTPTHTGAMLNAACSACPDQPSPSLTLKCSPGSPLGHTHTGVINTQGRTCAAPKHAQLHGRTLCPLHGTHLHRHAKPVQELGPQLSFLQAPETGGCGSRVSEGVTSPPASDNLAGRCQGQLCGRGQA